jgi:hypothetical protein
MHGSIFVIDISIWYVCKRIDCIFVTEALLSATFTRNMLSIMPVPATGFFVCFFSRESRN